MILEQARTACNKGSNGLVTAELQACDQNEKSGMLKGLRPMMGHLLEDVFQFHNDACKLHG